MPGPVRPLLAALALLTSASAAEAWTRCQSRPLPRGAPEEVGFDRALGADLDALLREAVEGRVTASAALAVARRGRLVYSGYAGQARPDSLFDLASLTKVVATAPAVMRLVEGKRIGLNDKVARYLPLIDVDNKREITLEQLLLHTSGLHSSVWAGPKSDGRDKILERIRRSALRARPGTAYRYSDLGYLLLGELVAAVGKASFDEIVERQVLEPLGMCQSGFRPPPSLRPRLVSPWPRREEQRLGVVYDPLAARAGGVAGHAGLYSTAEDLVRFGLMFLGGGQLAGKRVLSERTVALMLQPRGLPGGAPGQRGLGWDMSTPFAGSRGPLSRRAAGHSGFTGTSLWIDPELELVLVLLTNRTHLADPGGARAPSVSQLRRRVHQTIVGALERPPPTPPETGLDRLVSTGFAGLRGRRVGLITNRTAIDRRGRWIGDLLLEPAAGVELRALFVPEHGLDARLDRRIKDGELRRGARRVPIFSLFGSRRRPSDETLDGIDTLVIDLQTVGVRYYTYLATMGWAMEEAARRKLRFVVLDRPNPLGGEVQGPLSSSERRTSTNYHPLPVRYGMTLGELAGYFRAGRRIPVKLEVVKVRGWQRSQLFPETGLRWVDPSPNIRSFRQALLYAGVGLLESTPLAVGRGTDSPFQIVGAPWLDARALAAALNRRALPGVRAVAESFTPAAGPYRGERCQGVRLVITDPRAVRAPSLGVAIAVELLRRHRADWETRNLYRLINHPPTTAAILAGKDLPEIERLWRKDLHRFLAAREKHLLYR